MNDGGGASRTTEPAAGSSAATDISLREFFQALRNGDEARGRERLGWLLFLIAVVWFEIQRRLENLNHENARILAAQQSSISKDTYDANEQQRKSEQLELSSWRKEVDKDRTQAVSREEFQRDTRVEKRAVLNSNVGITIVVIGLIGAVIGLLTYLAATH